MRLLLTPLDWVVCLGALAFNMLLGLYLALRARQKSDSSSFLLAGRTLTWPIVGASLFATNIGAEHMVGLFQGLADWRLHWALLAAITVLAYAWLW
jgi:solute:Na+ symporter, SSS family